VDFVEQFPDSLTDFRYAHCPPFPLCRNWGFSGYFSLKLMMLCQSPKTRSVGAQRGTLQVAPPPPPRKGREMTDTIFETLPRRVTDTFSPSLACTRPHQVALTLGGGALGYTSM